MTVPWWGVVPFATLLSCIALFPLLPRARRLWEHPWFQLLIALSLGLPMGLWMWSAGEHEAVLHALVEYGQFMILILSLFVVSGGLFVSGDIRATPRNNTLFLAFGALIASFVGTTGASMLLIRPILNTNSERQFKVHTVVFAIFIVSNCGGLLTPLGDPPLFLGMLRGVPFLWTFHLLGEWLFVNGLLLVSYYALDRKLYAQESPTALMLDDTLVRPLGIEGKVNLLWFAIILLAVALLPSVDLHAIFAGHASLVQYLPVRETVMLLMCALSYLGGNPKTRFEHNRFQWTPILEVAALFIGIFLTMVPALKFLAQVAPLLPLNEVTFLFFTGALSSVLDNAPTYATFFEMAKQLGGSPSVAGVRELYLTSISLGAVFFGACTYIGNGPNFLVKSTAEAARVPMPSFVGYTAKWVLRYLLPVLILMALIFIVQDLWFNLVGVVLALGWVGRSLLQARAYPDPHTRRQAALEPE